jgi:hypothetical protein
MPPIYHRVWFWILTSVQHEQFLFPTRKPFGIHVLPGQKITSVREIAEGVKWTEWGKEKVPNPKAISDVLEWLEGNSMIEVESNDKGTFINITNSEFYIPKTIEQVTEDSTERERGADSGTDSGTGTNKNVKNENNGKKGKKAIVPTPYPPRGNWGWMRFFFSGGGELPFKIT